MIVSKKAITDKGIGDEDFRLCRGNSDTLALDGDHFLPTHFGKRRMFMKKGMYKMLATALMLTISGGGSRQCC